LVRGARFEAFGKPEAEGRAEVYTANPAYLESVRLPLLRGRWFTDGDTATSSPVAVLSELVAHRFWGDDDPIGRRVRLNSDRPSSPWVTIVGVVGDVKNPTADHWQPTAYRPWSQVPSSGAILMIRAGVADPQSLAGAVRRELRAIDPTAPELRMANLAAEVLNYGSQQRFTTILLAAFAIIGLLLASAGVYGVMRYWVASRTGEIGIRVALGAQRGAVLRLVLGRSAGAAAAGVMMGLAGAIALRKVMATQLISVSPVDPVVLGTVSIVIFGVAVLAAWAPARRAARVDPAEALRAE
jgi:putative ABC transport system permease protein